MPFTSDLNLILDKWMRERVVERYAFGGIEREDLVQKVLELHDLAQLLFGQVLVGNQLLLEVPRRLDDVDHNNLLLKGRVMN